MSISTIKEYHFHCYFEEAEIPRATEFYNYIESRKEFVVRILRLNETKVGPHPCPSFEIWVPIEYFNQFYSFILFNRPDKISVLIHPLTRMEIMDHTVRACIIGDQTWLSKLDLGTLHHELKDIPLQYPELKLGYSASS